MALPDRALEVLTLMVQRGIGERPTLFICHSLGGLLAKQVLRKSTDATDPRQKQVAANTRAILFLATPHSGAVLASLLNTFREVFGSTVNIEDLCEHDTHLRDLYNWFRNHAPAMRIETATFYEMRGVRGLVPIVNPTSAHPGVGADPVPLDEDHLSIAKPRSRDDLVYGAASDLLHRHVLRSRAVADVPPRQAQTGDGYAARELFIRVAPAPAAGGDAHRVPHELPPAAEQFFGRTTELHQLTERLRAGKNTAVVGPAGMGKTALAAAAVRSVVGETFDANVLSTSPFPDGVVFLDLYVCRGQAEAVWNTLANRLAGVEFMERSPARDRAAEACRARRILVVVEGGEEADSRDGRPSIAELFSVLSPENRRLLLTRLGTQSATGESVELTEALHPDDAAKLFDSLSKGRVPATVRGRVLELLEGHPLALTWAGNLLGRGDDDPERLLTDWETARLPVLSDPVQAEHTLEWLFERSARGLDGAARQVLLAAGLLARAPFSIHVMHSVLAQPNGNHEDGAREALRSLVQRGLLRRLADYWEFTHVLGYRFARQETGSQPMIRERVAQSLHDQLVTALALGADVEWTLTVGRILEHTAALLRADDDHRLWTPLARFTLYKAVDRLLVLGRLDLVQVAVRAISGWMERFTIEEAEKPYWIRERSTLLNRQGKLLKYQGDLSGALVAYQGSLALRKQLTTVDPSHIYWQRDLTLSHDNVGDVLLDQGELTGALAAYRKSLEMMERIASSDPLNATWQRDLSVSHGKVGDVLHVQGDFAGALESYQQSLEVRQRLARADSSNFDRQRDIGVAYVKLGSTLRRNGELVGALAAYEKGLEISQRLTSSDPSNSLWQRDLSVTFMGMAKLHQLRGNITEAIQFATTSYAIAERLVALDPTNVLWQEDLEASRTLVEELRGAPDRGSD